MFGIKLVIQNVCCIFLQGFKKMNQKIEFQHFQEYANQILNQIKNKVDNQVNEQLDYQIWIQVLEDVEVQFLDKINDHVYYKLMLERFDCKTIYDHAYYKLMLESGFGKVV